MTLAEMMASTGTLLVSSNEDNRTGGPGRWVLRRLLVNVAVTAVSLSLFGLLFFALVQP